MSAPNDLPELRLRLEGLSPVVTEATIVEVLRSGGFEPIAVASAPCRTVGGVFQTFPFGRCEVAFATSRQCMAAYLLLERVVIDGAEVAVSCVRVRGPHEADPRDEAAVAQRAIAARAEMLRQRREREAERRARQQRPPRSPSPAGDDAGGWRGPRDDYRGQPYTTERDRYYDDPRRTAHDGYDGRRRAWADDDGYGPRYDDRYDGAYGGRYERRPRSPVRDGWRDHDGGDGGRSGAHQQGRRAACTDRRDPYSRDGPRRSPARVRSPPRQGHRRDDVATGTSAAAADLPRRGGGGEHRRRASSRSPSPSPSFSSSGLTSSSASYSSATSGDSSASSGRSSSSSGSSSGDASSWASENRPEDAASP